MDPKAPVHANAHPCIVEPEPHLTDTLPPQQTALPLQDPDCTDDLNDPDHPYPVEIRLPPWTLREDVDFRRWLFGFGDAIYIEKPEELRIMQVNQARRLMATIAAKAEAENVAKLEAWERRDRP